MLMLISSSSFIRPCSLAPEGILSAILSLVRYRFPGCLRLHLSEHSVHYFHLYTTSLTCWTLGFVVTPWCQFHFLYLWMVLVVPFTISSGLILFYSEVVFLLPADVRRPAETTKTAKMSTEYISKLTENIIHVHSAAKAATSCSANTSMTILVGSARLLSSLRTL